MTAPYRKQIRPPAAVAKPQPRVKINKESRASMTTTVKTRPGTAARSAAQVLEQIAANSVPGPNGCRIWTSDLTNAGYGELNWKPNGVVIRGAHRVAYTATNGPIAPGKVIDHLCRVRACVNPDHMEPVTQRENIDRSPIAGGKLNVAKTHCPAGHEYTPDNTGRQGPSRRWRYCKICRRANNRARRLARRLSKAVSA